MTTRAILASTLWLVACLKPPPPATPSAHEEPPAEPVPAPVPIPVAPAEPPPVPSPNCPLVTGKHQACTEVLVCERDERGCERCTCRENLKSDRPDRDAAETVQPE
jgi:hypothetical protein